jgi:sugar O-acyltransferase (sialic acid O-acetyltransferase NeuD family)
MQNYIFGAGGHGKVVLDAMQSSGMICAGFVDDKQASTWMGLSIIKASALKLNAEVRLHLAVGSCKTREDIAGRLINAQYFNVYHSTAVIAKTAQIGLGTFAAAQSIIASDAKIGNHCIINHAAVVDHDCVIGDFAHIAPHSSLGGGVTVGKCVLIGAGAIILPGVTIADYAIIGAGAVVIQNVAAGTTVVGNPAKLIKV